MSSDRVLRLIRQQRRAWTIPVTQPLLLCSQVQRSGGTLLSRLFDGHPSCLTHPNELRWGRPRGWPSVSLGPDSSAKALFAEVREKWPRKFARHGYTKDVIQAEGSHADRRGLPFIFDEELQYQIFADALPSDISTQRDVLNAYLTSLFNAWLDYQHLYCGSKRWVTAFEPRFLTRSDGGADVFFADYPDGILVTIVREPSAWLASYRRHIPSHDAGKALQLWNESVEAGLRAHADRPDRVIVLMFEDLVHRTEAVMRDLSERMNIPFEDSMLVPTYDSMPVPSDSSHTPVFGIDPLVTERHRHSPDPVECPGMLEKASLRYDEVHALFARR